MSGVAYVFTLSLLLRLCLNYFREIQTSGPDKWRIGDWLINYSGGFVRRGLLGQVVLWLGDLAPASGPAGLWSWVFAIQVAAYVVYYGLSARLLAKAGYLPFYFLFFSPAFLIFPYLCWMGAFRKESLHLALFAIACHAVAIDAKRAALPVAGAILVLVPVFVLTHELLFALLPYYLLLGWYLLRPRGQRVYFGWAAAVVAEAVACLGAVLTHKGSDETARTICTSLTTRGFKDDICEGAIAWLPLPAEVGHERVVEMASHPGVIWKALLACALASAPLVYAWRGMRRSDWMAPHLRRAGAAAGASLLLTAPIAWTALDWGRLIHIQVATMTILLLALGARWAGALRSDPAPPLSPGRFAWFALSLLLFATPWSLQHYEGLVASGLDARLFRRAERLLHM